MKISDKQIAMLKSFRDDGMAADLDDFDMAGDLAWANRERVIKALRRKGLLADDDTVTEAGLTALSGH